MGLPARRASFLLLAAPLLAVPPAVSQEAPKEEDPLVLVKRVIDARYSQAENFDILVRSPIERAHTVKPGETISGIVSDLFGVGPTSSPDEYRAIVEYASERNEIENSDRIRSGQTIVLPDLPPKARRASEQRSAMPRVWTGPRYEDVKSGRAFDYSQQVYLPPFLAMAAMKDRPTASPYVIQWRWLPASVARKELLAVAAPSTRTTTVSGPIRIRLAQDDGKAPAARLDADAAFVRGVLSRRAPKHESVLYVLDDSWPSQDAFAQSIRFFRSAVARVRQHYHLGKDGWAAGLLAPQPRTDFPFEADKRESHARLLADALAPFSKLSPNVRIVYVPLFVEQDLSSDFWREIFFVVQTARNKGAALEDPYEPTREAIKSARSTAEDLTKLLPSKMQKDIVDTDQAVISALLEFAHMHAVATGEPFFLNMSWIVEYNTFEFQPNADSLGVTLAAVGNEVNSDIMARKTQFAYRAKESPGDIVAIMNTAADGTITCSSRWSVPAGQIFYGFAYEGVLPDGRCGTSFSAPRVAWLLALREAYNDRVVPAHMPYWFGHYRKRLLGLQDTTATDYRRYWLSPAKVFEGL